MSCLKHNLIAILLYITLAIGPALALRVAAIVTYATMGAEPETTAQELVVPLDGLMASHLSEASGRK